MSSCNECVDVMLPLLVSVLEPPHYSTNEEATCVALKRIYKALCVLSDILAVPRYIKPAVWPWNEAKLDTDTQFLTHTCTHVASIVSAYTFVCTYS